jgi:hypothetical protein
MSSSVHARFRSFSQMKVAYRTIGVAIAIGFISCSHILFGYDLRPRCATLPGSFAMYDGMFVVFWLGVIPHVLMLVFGFFTYMNIKRSKRRVAIHSQRISIVPCQQQGREQKTERQLIVVSSRWEIRKVEYYGMYFFSRILIQIKLKNAMREMDLFSIIC